MSENPTEDYKIPDLDVIDEDYTQALDKAVLQPQYNDINVMLSRNIHHQQSSQEKPSSQTSNEDFNLTTNLKLNLPGIRVESYDTNSSSKLVCFVYSSVYFMYLLTYSESIAITNSRCSTTDF